MQRFDAAPPRYSYSAEHAMIGTVAAGERFEVESVEGFSNYFRSASDFTPERYALAEDVRGAVAVTIYGVEVTGPGVVVYGAYEGEDVEAWWDDESACAVYPVEDGRLRFDEQTSLPLRPLIGCLATMPEDGDLHAKLQGRYGGNMDCPELRAGATLVLPV